jgi:hypothetical protein
VSDAQARLQLLTTGRQAPSSRSQVTTTVRWTSRELAPPLHRPSADQLVTVDPDIVAMTTDLMRRAHPAMADAFTRRLVPIAQRAYDHWPVDTGFSRSRLSATWEASDDALTFTLEAGADYSDDIHDGAVVQELLVDPVQAAAPRIAADVARHIVRR